MSGAYLNRKLFILVLLFYSMIRINPEELSFVKEYLYLPKPIRAVHISPKSSDFHLQIKTMGAFPLTLVVEHYGFLNLYSAWANNFPEDDSLSLEARAKSFESWIGLTDEINLRKILSSNGPTLSERLNQTIKRNPIRYPNFEESKAESP